MVITLLGLRDQLAFGNDDTCNNVRALIEEFGRRIFQHAILLGDVKEAVLREAPAIGHLLWQGRSELLHLIAHAAARAVGHRPDFRLARAHKCRDALWTDRDMAGVRHERIKRNVKAWRKLDLR